MARFFDCPDYLSFQKDTLLKLPDRKPKDPTGEARRAALILEISDDLTQFVREAEPETLRAALFDAHLILSHILHAKIDGQTLKQIVHTAKAIGRLGETIDQYIRAGGSVNDDRTTGEVGQLFSAKSGDSWSATATADGGSSR